MTALDAGGYAIPSGHLATVVTYLELQNPVADGPGLPIGVTCQREHPDAQTFRAFFIEIGAPWLWASRLRLPLADISALIADPNIHIGIVRRDDRAIGLVELDLREPEICEIAFFGLIPGEGGNGLGKAMMNYAKKIAQNAKIKLMTVHTCTMDSPAALKFYQGRGFTPVKHDIEVYADPRALGDLPKDSAAHIPQF